MVIRQKKPQISQVKEKNNTGPLFFILLVVKQPC